MSVEAGTSTPSNPAPGRSEVSPLEAEEVLSPDTTDPSAPQDLMEESDELRRRRRHRRRRTVADLPTKQKRFRLLLLGLVIFALVIAATGKELRSVIGGPVSTITHALPLQQIKRFLRPELILLLAAVFVMLVLVFPDLEEKVLVTLGFQKPRRGGSRHRSSSSRRR